jgi:hypothetical protein
MNIRLEALWIAVAFSWPKSDEKPKICTEFMNMPNSGPSYHDLQRIEERYSPVDW